MITNEITDCMKEVGKSCHLSNLNNFIRDMECFIIGKTENLAKIIEFLLEEYNFCPMTNTNDNTYSAINMEYIYFLLNGKSFSKTSKYHLPKSLLPKRMIHIGTTPNDNMTVELYLDKGWQFNFKIQKEKSHTTTALHFKPEIVSMPKEIAICYNVGISSIKPVLEYGITR